MRICAEMYFDNDHATTRRSRDRDLWNVILWEATPEGEPIMDGWEKQPFGERRFSYDQAKSKLRDLVNRLARQHEVRRLIGVAEQMERRYPDAPIVYRTELSCERLDYNDML